MRPLITIYGGVPDLGIPDNTALLIGSFGTASVYYLGGTFNITGASFYDIKNENLLHYYGLPLGPYEGYFNISFNAPFLGSGNPFTSTSVLSGDVANYPVPAPAAVWLLGSGIIGFVGLRRKFTKR